MSPTFVLRHATPWSIYFRPTLNYTALWELFWNFTWWFKLLKVPVPMCEQRFDVHHVFQVFTNMQGGHPRPWLVTQRRGSRFVLISGLISQTYLQNHRFEERLQLLNKLLHYVVSLHSTLTYFQDGLRNLHLHAAKEQFCNQLHSSALYFTVAIWSYPIRHSFFFRHLIVLNFPSFHYRSESIFRQCNFPLRQFFRAVNRFSKFTFSAANFSKCHSLVFSTSSSCRWWTTSQQLGPPHRSSLLLFSFLVLKAVGFEQSVQSKDKIKSLQVCVYLLYRSKTS